MLRLNDYKRWRLGLLLGLVPLLLVLALSHTGVMRRANWLVQDNLFNFGKSIPADSSVVLISIDNNALLWARKNLQQGWPWPRSMYGYAIDWLTKAGAVSISIDLQFYDEDFDRAEINGADADAAFAYAMQQSGKVWLGAQLGQGADSTASLANPGLKIGGNVPAQQWKSGLFPLPGFCQSAAGVGIINVQPDADGVIRRVQLLHKVNGRTLPALPIAHMADSVYYNNPNLQLANYSIPVDDNGRYSVYWYGKGGAGQSFTYYSLAAILQQVQASLTGVKGQLNPSLFKGKHIIIGATAAGLLDLKTVPTDRIFPGMEIWATVLSNILQSDYLCNLRTDTTIGWLYLYGLLVYWLITRGRGRWLPLLFALALAGPFAFTWWAWNAYHVVFPLGQTVLMLAVAGVWWGVIGYLVEGREKMQLRALFNRYLSPELIDDLVNRREQLRLGGKRQEATVLFSDISGFTSYSQDLPPEQVVDDLNSYFKTITPVVLRHGGLLDKYTGDGLMALFGVPVKREDHAILACKAALSMVKYSKKAAASGRLGSALGRTRVGVNSGPLVAGNIGSDQRTDYTAVGNTVNQAARLEGVNKHYGTSVIIGHATKQLVGNRFIVRELDQVQLKGISMAQPVYELIGETGVDIAPAWLPTYHKALRLWRERRFKQAQPLFAQIAALGDKPSQLKLDDCIALSQNPPSEDWDGVRRLEVK